MHFINLLLQWNSVTKQQFYKSEISIDLNYVGMSKKTESFIWLFINSITMKTYMLNIRKCNGLLYWKSSVSPFQ